MTTMVQLTENVYWVEAKETALRDRFTVFIGIGKDQDQSMVDECMAQCERLLCHFFGGATISNGIGLWASNADQTLERYDTINVERERAIKIELACMPDLEANMRKLRSAVMPFRHVGANWIHVEHSAISAHHFEIGA